mmetsp:Transcript_20608/g.64889  ORF Transcript_20608/g.64889 Transcript_20608/m.64889 type:complete len:213 (-) Transcript_20608:559-1197(-)
MVSRRSHWSCPRLAGRRSMALHRRRRLKSTGFWPRCSLQLPMLRGLTASRRWSRRLGSRRSPPSTPASTRWSARATASASPSNGVPRSSSHGGPRPTGSWGGTGMPCGTPSLPWSWSRPSSAPRPLPRGLLWSLAAETRGKRWSCWRLQALVRSWTEVRRSASGTSSGGWRRSPGRPGPGPPPSQRQQREQRPRPPALADVARLWRRGQWSR